MYSKRFPATTCDQGTAYLAMRMIGEVYPFCPLTLEIQSTAVQECPYIVQIEGRAVSLIVHPVQQCPSLAGRVTNSQKVFANEALYQLSYTPKGRRTG